MVTYNFCGNIRIEGSLKSENMDDARMEAAVVMDQIKTQIPDGYSLYIEPHHTIYRKIEISS